MTHFPLVALVALVAIAGCAAGAPGASPDEATPPAHLDDGSYVPSLSEVSSDSVPKADQGEVDRIVVEADEDKADGSSRGTVTITYSSLQGWERVANLFAGVAIQATPDAAVDAIIERADGRSIRKLRIIGHGDRGDQSFAEVGDLANVATNPGLVAALSRLTPHFAHGAEVELQGCLVGSGYAGAVLLDDLAYLFRERSVAVIAGTNFQRPLLPGWEGHVHARRYVGDRGTWHDDFGGAERIRWWFFSDSWLANFDADDPVVHARAMRNALPRAASVRVAAPRHRRLMYGFKHMNETDDPELASELAHATIETLEAIVPDERYYFFADVYGTRDPLRAWYEDDETFRFLTDGMPDELVPRLEAIVRDASENRAYDGKNLRGTCGDTACTPWDHCAASLVCEPRATTLPHP